MRTLFLNPPSFEGFDGGAGSRYQARREIRSFWYPTWLAQPAALVPDSKLIDAPPDDVTVEQVLKASDDFEMTVLHTSTPSFANDVKVAEALKDRNPKMKIGFVGAHVAVLPVQSIQQSKAIDFVCGEEFDFTIKEIAEGKPLEDVEGITYRNGSRNDPSGIRTNKPRPILEEMDQLPWVVPVYKRDLTPENYAIGYLLHPYLSLYTGRGCRSKCTFCLWPQTIGGHRYRVRSVDNVVAEMKLAKEMFPQVREVMFDDDTFTDDIPRAEAIAKKLGKLGITWSCNAKAIVPYETLKIMKDNGLRLLLVGYESGSQEILNNIKKGVRIDRAQEFTQNCHKLGITIHGTFIIGLPGETKESIENTIEYAMDLDIFSLQVSLAAPYPGTELYRQAIENNWVKLDQLVDGNTGFQTATIEFPGLSKEEMFEALDVFYRRYYFRPKQIVRIVKSMVRDRNEAVKKLHEGWEFLLSLRERKQPTMTSAAEHYS